MNIEAKNLSKIYGDGENRVVALDRANLEIVSSDFISISLSKKAVPQQRGQAAVYMYYTM